ncbi:MAG: hypothetical protein AMJ81_07660 [Phycisphaerae bacterium SM23_33]|nr:MAG: hypothetical protein AMJ81_07660 [Phycisphaerae bacterium SM23_33]
MSANIPPLYDKERAAASRGREEYLAREGDSKWPLLLEHIGACRRLVDLGCGWGQLLHLAAGRVEEVWGVDESPDRIKDAARACPRAKLVCCRMQQLQLPGGYFDVAVACQVLHEVKLFGAPEELQAALGEIRRVLSQGGRFLLLDHLDAGAGEVAVALPPEGLDRLRRFERKFTCYAAAHAAAGEGVIRIAKRTLQDFLTKAHWLDSAMEELEMKETHNVFQSSGTIGMLESAGLAVEEWIEFADIRRDLASFGAGLTAGGPWRRKFLAVAIKK